MSSLRRIASKDNALLREVAHLADSARERRKRGESFVEGAHLCAAYLDRFGEPRVALAAASALVDPEIAAIAARCGGRLAVVEDALYRGLSQLAGGAGIAFVVPTPAGLLPDRIDTDCVFLDRLQDPGNVGSILRSAAAAGVRLVVTAPQTAFAWSPKVLRAGMGAHFALTLCEGVEWATLSARLRCRALGTRLRDAQPLHRTDLRPPACWIFGNEGEGVTLDDTAIDWVYIPQADAVESLNVAAAAAVCLFEQRRQREAA